MQSSVVEEHEHNQHHVKDKPSPVGKPYLERRSRLEHASTNDGGHHSSNDNSHDGGSHDNSHDGGSNDNSHDGGTHSGRYAP